MADKTVLVTRPVEQAGPWLLALRARGWPAQAVPLLSIEPPSNPEPLQTARRILWSPDPPSGTSLPAAVMFVSPSAVAQFWAGEPGDQPDRAVQAGPAAQAGSTAPAWPGTTLAVATGPGTADALRRRGVPAAQLVQPPADAPAFDSEHVWPELVRRPWQGSTVWIVRGETGRDWLADRWRSAGAAVQVVEAYRRVAPVWTAAQEALVQRAVAQPQSHVWLFSSSEALRHLAHQVPLATRVAAIATHPAIAKSAGEVGFVRTVVAQPMMDAVIACLESEFRG